MTKTEYDSIVVGSGPNGLLAAIVLQQAGLSVLLIEAKDEIGGGLRSAELTLPHFIHDVCSAIHPLAASSPFFKTLPLEKHGLEFAHPGIALVHPFDDGSAVILQESVERTARELGKDNDFYLDLMRPIVRSWPRIVGDILAPLRFPKRPIAMADFGLKAIRSADQVAKQLQTEKARGLWAGMAAHSMQPFSNAASSAPALVLMAIGHRVGWPVVQGGSGALARALASYFLSLGGTIQTNLPVQSLDQLPSSKAVLLDVTPRQLMDIAGYKFSPSYKRQLSRYRYGMGVFKIDWALNAPVPFTAPACCLAGTLHLGNRYEEIALSEKLTAEGKHSEKPFVLFAQQTLADPSRAPRGKHTAWAYCHVPNGSKEDMTGPIEDQVERFAPGFRELVIGRHTMNTKQIEEYNSNYIGGDIGGGMMNLRQLFARPALRWSPYKTSAKGIYICSSSTPPGGGAHGMCGYHAARKALMEIFHKKI